MTYARPKIWILGTSINILAYLLSFGGFALISADVRAELFYFLVSFSIFVIGLPFSLLLYGSSPDILQDLVSMLSQENLLMGSWFILAWMFLATLIAGILSMRPPTSFSLVPSWKLHLFTSTYLSSIFVLCMPAVLFAYFLSGALQSIR